MITARQQRILTHLHEGAYVEVKELARELGVDDSTIRRDLISLSRSGKVERLHGGVRLPADVAPSSPPAYPVQQTHLAIASGARRFVRTGDSLLLGSGPISERLAGMLLDLDELTVITNDVRTAQQLGRNPGIAVRLAGGDLRGGSTETSGDETVEYLERQRADWAFVEVGGVHPFAGLTISTPWHVAARRALLLGAQRRCILAESSAFGARMVGFVAEPASVDLIITDEQLPDSELPAFGGRVIRSDLSVEEDWRFNPDRYAP